MKQGIIGSLLAVLFGFCLLPSVANTWTPQDFVRLVKTVEVKGEVAAPGVYEVAWDADVETILAAAGGAGEEADLSGIRLSQIVANESVIVIPKKSEQPKKQPDLPIFRPLLPSSPQSAARALQRRLPTNNDTDNFYL